MESEMKLKKEIREKVDVLFEAQRAHDITIQELSKASYSNYKKGWAILKKELKLDPSKTYAYSELTGELIEKPDFNPK